MLLHHVPAAEGYDRQVAVPLGQTLKSLDDGIITDSKQVAD